MALFCLGGSALAQVSGTLSVVSDYRYRGVSLSDDQPAAQAGLDYDSAQGWYAGAFVSTVKSSVYEGRGVQAIGFGGYAWRLASGVSLEAGADYVAVTAPPRYDYPEVYAGFAFQNVSGRVHYSPRYFGQPSDAAYGELNLAQPLFEHVRLLAHVGALWGNANERYGYPSAPPVDGAAGIAVDWQGFTLQASWVGISHASGAYAINGVEHRNGVVVSLSWAF